MLDGALQAAMGIHKERGSESLALPYTVDRIEWFAPCETQMQAYVHERGDMLDVDLCTSSGAVCVRMAGIRSRVAKEQAALLAPVCELVTERIAPDHFDGVEHFLWNNSDPLAFFRFIKERLAKGDGKRALRWTVVGRGAILGFAGSIAQEYPHWKMRLLEADAYTEEMATLPFGTYCERAGQWHARQLLPVQLSAPEQSAYRKGGVYVVIGGAGGIGEAWSEYVIRTYQAQVVWIGRSACDPKQLDRLGKLGPRPLYIQADATDQQELVDAYAAIMQQVGAPNGVVHSAIVLKDRTLANMDEQTFQEVFRVKAAICENIEAVFEGTELDFVLFFSSMQAFSPAAGQSNYAAGCRFMDAFAHDLARKWPCSIKVMNWSFWGSVGIVASKKYRERMAVENVGSIEPPEAMEALEKLLAGPLDQLALVKPLGSAKFAEEFIEELPQKSVLDVSVLC